MKKEIKTLKECLETEGIVRKIFRNSFRNEIGLGLYQVNYIITRKTIRPHIRILFGDKLLINVDGFSPFLRETVLGEILPISEHLDDELTPYRDFTEAYHDDPGVRAYYIELPKFLGREIP